MCGAVETPLFPADSAEPDYLIVRLASRVRRALPIVPVALVESVDVEREVVYVAATRHELAAFPQHLPVAR
jgi:hypothetical protein